MGILNIRYSQLVYHIIFDTWNNRQIDILYNYSKNDFKNIIRIDEIVDGKM